MESLRCPRTPRRNCGDPAIVRFKEALALGCEVAAGPLTPFSARFRTDGPETCWTGILGLDLDVVVRNVGLRECAWEGASVVRKILRRLAELGFAEFDEDAEIVYEHFPLSRARLKEPSTHLVLPIAGLFHPAMRSLLSTPPKVSPGASL